MCAFQEDCRSPLLTNGGSLQRLNKTIVVCVRADEVPNGGVSGADTDCAPTKTDTNRENGLSCVDLLKLKPRVPRISQPCAVCAEGQLQNIWRKARKELSELFSGSGNHEPSPVVESAQPRTPAGLHQLKRQADPAWRRTPLPNGVPNRVRRGKAKQEHPVPRLGAWTPQKKHVQGVVSWFTAYRLYR